MAGIQDDASGGKRLRIIPLGGLGEIGKNMMALECGSDIVVIDAGLMFPSEEMLGVDLLIPDISYLLEKQRNIKGIIITHAHQDHIGALPYVLPRLDLPIYTSRFSGKFISAELKQRGVKNKPKLNIVHAGSRITLGSMSIEFFPVCHSIPDSMGLIIQTPVGTIVHSGDFKIDHTPVIGQPTDLHRLAQLGAGEVLLLLSDSTYVELPGYTPSEMVVSDALEHIVSRASGRVVVATFSSLIARLQQVIDVAVRYNRCVFVTGRSMQESVRVAMETGYLSVPPDTLRNVGELNSLPPGRVVILATGSQGEPTSALVRMANGDHGQVQIMPGDTVVMSATPIPGNEALVSKTIDSLFRQGADVIYGRVSQVHVHGHGSQEELKLMLKLVKPKFFIPVHGEYRHLILHARLAESLGVPRENIFILDNGDILELGHRKGRVVGRVPAGDVVVNGPLTSELDNNMIRDRRLLSRDGIVMVTLAVDERTGRLQGKPQVATRGFVDLGENQTLIGKSQDVVMAALRDGGKRSSEHGQIEARARNSLRRFLYEETHRRPVIVLSIVEVGGKPRGA